MANKENEEKNSTRREHQKKVADILGKVEDALLKRSIEKVSLGDYIRLVQLNQELGDEQPTELRVRWVKPNEKESGK